MAPVWPLSLPDEHPPVRRLPILRSIAEREILPQPMFRPGQTAFVGNDPRPDRRIRTWHRLAAADPARLQLTRAMT